jgi:hypothetical protein
MCSLNVERDFPIDVEYIFIEIINVLRPNFKFASTFTQANELVNDLEKEFRENLAKSLKQNNNDELQAIGEEDEEDEEGGEYDEDSDSYNQNDDELIRNSYSHDFDGEGETEESGGKVRNNSTSLNNQNSGNNNSNANNGNQSSDDNDGGGGGGGESSDREDVVLQARPSNRQVTQEDEEFIKAFESVVTENIVVIINCIF